ncbi:MAG: hypothetical protein RR630_06335 [Coprobacillus sp.]
MKVNDFVEKAKKIEKMKTKYKLGTYMNKVDDDVYLTDGAGFIKGILWGYPEAGRYGENHVPDINANTMISQCLEVTTNFTKAQSGWLVWMEGHIGVYIGNGIVIEATHAWKGGVLRTFCKGSGFENIGKLNERQWTKCGMFDKYIEY